MQLVAAVSLIVAAQVTVYYSILDRTVGSARGLGRLDAGRPQFRVAVLQSDASAKLNPDHPEFYFDLARQWESVIKDAREPYRIVRDSDVTRGLGNSADVLVLPWAVCLDDAQRQAIEAFADSGKGLVFSGATGARGGDCSWKGWDFLGRLTGMKRLTANSAAAFQGAFTGGSFYSGLVPAGYRLSLAGQATVQGSAGKADLYAADARLRPMDAAPGGALAVHGTRGRGRFVWFGFPETMPAKDPADRVILNAYLLSAVRWAGRRPVAAVANWPRAARSAVVVAARVSDSNTARSTMSVLRENHTPATFFLDGKTAAQAPELLRSLAELGEIASSGDTPESFGGQAVSRQTTRLADARRRMRNAGGVNLAGFAPSDNLWDAATVTALRDAGFAYYIDRIRATRAVPNLVAAPSVSYLPVRQVPLARLEAPFADDFETMAESLPVALADRLQSDFQIVENAGGVYTLSFRTDLLGSPENAPVLRGLLHTFRSHGAWMATGSELAEWWIRRERVRADVFQVNDRRIRLAVSNSGRYAIFDSSVYVYLPRVPGALRMIPAMLGGSIPHYQIDGDGVLRVDFPKLAARSSYACLISMDEK